MKLGGGRDIGRNYNWKKRGMVQWKISESHWSEKSSQVDVIEVHWAKPGHLQNEKRQVEGWSGEGLEKTRSMQLEERSTGQK